MSRSKRIPVDSEKKKILSRGDYILENLHEYRVNRQSFEVYIGGDPKYPGDPADLDFGEPGVEYMMADRFEINLRLLSNIDPGRTIFVHMASCGGDWDAGMQMFTAILTCPNPVVVIALKWARSMTSIIPLAADKFLMRPNAKYMYHHGPNAFSGLDQEMATYDIERRKNAELMMRIYANRLKSQGQYKGRSLKQIRNKLDKLLKEKIDVWFSADKAVEWGFADGVFEGDYSALCLTKKNRIRRNRLLKILRQEISVEIKIS